MPYNYTGGLPAQQLSYSRKNKTWRKQCVDFGDKHSLMHNHVSRMSWQNMRINYDLLEGKIHMADMKAIINPFGIQASFIPDNIQHYPIINSKLNVLKGEESTRIFDYRAIVTNPNSISEIEEEKNNKVRDMLMEIIADGAVDEESYNQELQKQSDYFQYEYQDKREVRANRILDHYSKEQEFDQLFNKGFTDAYTVAEEIYHCDIVGGEPILEKVDPRTIRILRSGYSSKIEDADMIVWEEYKSPGWIIDTYWDQLSKKDMEYLEYNPDDRNGVYADGMGNIDSSHGNPLIPLFHDWEAGDAVINPTDLFNENSATLTPYDLNGNVRVLRVYWKSRRKIKKVKSYDSETGEELFNFYPETYYCDPERGEEEEIFWINEAWEGTKIGDHIYIGMGPRPIQYNRLSNPSRCHFGFIGSIYNINGDRPFSMVDMVKPYAYLYDVIHDRLNKTLAKNQGKLVKFDLAKVPKDWDVERWLYYINVNGVVVEDSFKEGNIGAATGKLAGALNNASSGVVDASLGTEIQQYISLLEWISTKIGEILGISKQREGQISNRETVGGVERATLQSSHITQWLFFTHESVKKRVLECFLETTKIAVKGRKVKFEYILPTGAKETMEFDGDEFAECDYGIVVDNSNGAQELNQRLETLAQAALQNQILDFSTIMKIFTTKSLAEKQRMVEATERRLREQQQQQQQQQYELQQQQMQMNQQAAEQKMQIEYQMHQDKLENNILVAQINAEAEAQRFSLMNHDNAEANDLERDKMAEEARQFDEKLSLEKQKQQDDVRLKEKQINISKTSKK